jgi:hypothetical protein
MIAYATVVSPVNDSSDRKREIIGTAFVKFNRNDFANEKYARNNFDAGIIVSLHTIYVAKDVTI